MSVDRPPPNFLGTKFLGWFFIAFSALLLFSSLSRIIDRRDSESWPSTDGTVINSKIYQENRSRRWCFALHYRYVVDNTVFSSKRLSTSVMSNDSCSRDKDITAARVERWHPGAPIQVRYSQSDPRRAMIFRDDFTALYIFLALGGGFLVGGIMSFRKAAGIAQAHARDAKPAVI
ncbi:MAG: DUF3592 domain-containing protein [Pseudomonadota bacterium]